ncbi:peptidyl-prolyl cis-trans isomerase [Stappia sp. F7233]|uniref:Parvulin-like PPIase n=1 Tax=Stappia albiluteola TaxID=2758565 RepID=A0A839AF11_9HYPH|nr:peptidylprolyl isomerase [Stappia albiluteola]MBA5777534.1 peptidyl-prolyl cis-trans isomerase [Stappia albiluteola]
MSQTTLKRVLGRFARDPLLHFLVLGGVMSGVFVLLDDRTEALMPTEIRYTVDDVARLILGFETQWNRPPTQAEFNALVEDRVREDILYREALALGLDKDDTIVRRRMAQKMQFLAEDIAAAREPTIAELKSWYADNNRLFEMAPRLSFRHIYFSPDRRGKNAQADAAAALEELSGTSADRVEGSGLGDRFMFQDYYGERSLQAIAREFGAGFAQSIDDLQPGVWSGPVQSGLGWHLVRVDKVIAGRVPRFEEVANEVKTAWLGQQKAEAWRKSYDEMRAKYTVLLPVPEVESPGAAASPAQPVDRPGDGGS